MKFDFQEYDFQQAWGRLLRTLGVATQYQLGDKLGISQSAVNACLQRRKFPASWLLAIALKYSLNPMWLMWGEKYKKFLAPSDLEPEGGQDGSGGEKQMVRTS